MPKFAHIAERVPCPRCGADLAYIGRVGFQWGFCSHPYSDIYGERYQLGDPVLWGADAAGRMPTWHYFANDTGNIGDPRHGDVVVRENEFGIRECAGCGWAFGGIAVVVRGGRIEAVEAYPEWPYGADFATFGAGMVPRPEWDDRPMSVGPRGSVPAKLLPNVEARTMTD